MLIFCDYYFFLNKCCVMSDKSIAKACSKCILAKKDCFFSVVFFPQAGLEKFLHKHECLEKEKKSVVFKEQQLFKHLVQIHVKACHLEKQSRLLHKHGGCLIQKDIKNLEQLEALERVDYTKSENLPPLSFFLVFTVLFSASGELDLVSPRF